MYIYIYIYERWDSWYTSSKENRIVTQPLDSASMELADQKKLRILQTARMARHDS
jgi:hypothetical protein